jgi:hypothetical protein
MQATAREEIRREFVVTIHDPARFAVRAGAGFFNPQT